MSKDAFADTVKSLAAILTSQNKTIAVAESCTGGWIAKVLTDLSGSSAWFDRGFVTYSNQAKQEMLGVPVAVIESHGAVSQETVEAMASGVISHSHADFSVSVSGIAGPGGGSTDKPVGLVWFGWANKGGLLISSSKVFEGDRQAVRSQAVKFALEESIRLLSEN